MQIYKEKVAFKNEKLEDSSNYYYPVNIFCPPKIRADI
jgi:hypothetical protein